MFMAFLEKRIYLANVFIYNRAIEQSGYLTVRMDEPDKQHTISLRDRKDYYLATDSLWGYQTDQQLFC